MTIVTRSDLGRPLTWAELDGNFEEVGAISNQASVAVETATNQAQAAADFANTASDASSTAVQAASQAQAAVETAVAPVRDVSNNALANTRELWRRSLTEAGYNLVVGSFQQGGTLNSVSDALLDVNGSQAYSYSGSFPKVVAANSTPDNTFTSLANFNLRSQINENTVKLTKGDGTAVLSDILLSVTPEMWGAVGDGVTNDTLAIQAAIDYVSSTGGGEVALGPKTYIATNLILKPMVRLKGKGQYNTTVKAPNNWSGLAVLSSVNFTAYSQQVFTNGAYVLTQSGSYGASVEELYIHGNYDSFSGTPGKLSGMGVALAGICTILNVDIAYTPATGYVHLNFEGSPNTPSSYWPADKGLKSASVSSNISVKWCGNDCAYIENADSVYGEVLFGFPAKGVGTAVASFWDTTRGCCGVNFALATYVEKLHAYAYNGGIGVVFGHGDLTRGYQTYRYGTLVCETLCTAMWVRANAKVDGIKADFHNISMSLTLAEFGTTYGTYAPGCVIQSGQFITGQQTSRQQSDLGKITFWNFTVSGSQPTVGFMGTHIVVAGENNTVDVDIHRSRFLDPALGGLGLMLAGINNHVRGRITGFLATDSTGANSAAIQVQPGSVTSVDLDVNRCNVGLRWSSNASQPVLTGRINITDNVTEYVNSYTSASLLQRGRLIIDVPSGSNRQSALSGAVSVTVNTQQTISATVSLPYVPVHGEVKAWVLNTNSTAQTIYTEPAYIQYVPTESTLTSLVFRVKVNVVSGAAAGAVLGVKIN